MCLTKSDESGKDCKGVAAQKDLTANPCLTHSEVQDRLLLRKGSIFTQKTNYF